MRLPTEISSINESEATRESTIHDAVAQAARPPVPPVGLRSPLRDISPPPTIPQVNDDEDLGNRRRRVPKRSQELNVSISNGIDSQSSSVFPTAASSYFSNTSSSGSGLNATVGTSLFLSPTLNQTRPVLDMPTSASPTYAKDKEFSSNNENRQAKDRVRAHSTRNENAREEKGKLISDVSSDEFDDIEFDVDVLAGLDAIEATISSSTHSSVSMLASAPTNSFYSTGMSSQGSGREGPVPSGMTEVITIEDDSEESEKENVPVPTRHVRRRVHDLNGDETPAEDTQNFTNPERSTILTSDIIDLSDSD